MTLERYLRLIAGLLRADERGAGVLAESVLVPVYGICGIESCSNRDLRTGAR